MLEGWELAGVAGLSLLSMVAAAKTHGRHLRLEREQAGYFEVDLRREKNPEWVEQLWRTDRVGFWRLFPFLAALGGVAGLALDVPTNGLRLAAILMGMGLWGLTLTFLVQGARSWIRLDRATDARRPNQGWWNALHAATWFWWTTTLVLLAGAFFWVALNT